MKWRTIQLRGMSLSGLRTKLFGVCGFLVFLIGIEGMWGLFSLTAVKRDVGVLTETTVPLSQGSSDLAGDLQHMHVLIVQALAETDQSHLDTYEIEINKLDKKFHEESARMQQVGEATEIANQLTDLAQKEAALHETAIKVLGAQRTKLSKEKLARDRFDDFQTRMQALSTTLDEFAKQSEADLSEQGEKTKTVVQSGQAKVADLDLVLSSIFNQSYPVLQGVYTLIQYSTEMQDVTRTYLTTRDPMQLPALAEAFEAWAKRGESRLARLADLVHSEAQQTVQNSRQQFTEAREVMAGEKGMFVAVREALTATQAAQSYVEVLQQSITATTTLLDNVTAVAQHLSAQTREGTAKTVAWARSMLLGVMLIGISIGCLAAFGITRAITRPLMKVVGLLRDIAEGEGDLTRRLPVSSKDEIGELARWFNVFVEKLNGILGQVQQAADQVALASQQLSASGEQLSTGSQQQASSLEETAASLEEMTGTIKQNADNARQANQLAVGSREVAEKGGQVVTNTVNAMHEINKSSKKIADISGLIDEIAFQTNLLALNAAVEAARAGEQGRGFAVVAAEVRNLAQRSAAAAKEIKGLIQDSTEKVHDGSELVSKSGQALAEIVTSVKQVTDLMGDIAAAGQEQSNNIEQVNRVVAQMDHVVQENAAQTEEMSSTAQTLTQQAQQLQAMVGQFKLTGQHDQQQGRSLQHTPTLGLAAAKPAVKTLAKDYVNGSAKGQVNGHAYGQAGGFEEF